MALSICPKCHSKVAPTDTTCMDCGADLIAAKTDIVEQAKREARGGPAAPASAAAATAANAAAAGIAMPGENAEEKRLRTFDKQEADKLRQQRPAQVVLLAIAAVAMLVCAGAALGFLKKAAEIGGLKSLEVAAFKELGLEVISDPRILAISCLALALAGLLCVIGEIRRLLDTNVAIRLVDMGETPNLIHLSAFTQIGLLLAAFFLPPFGLICGIMFKFSRDADTRNIGGLMVYASLLAIAIVMMNWIWKASSELKSNMAPKGEKGGGDGAWLWTRFV